MAFRSMIEFASDLRLDTPGCYRLRPSYLYLWDTPTALSQIRNQTRYDGIHFVWSGQGTQQDWFDLHEAIDNALNQAFNDPQFRRLYSEVSSNTALCVFDWMNRIELVRHGYNLVYSLRFDPLSLDRIACIGPRFRGFHNGHSSEMVPNRLDPWWEKC